MITRKSTKLKDHDYTSEAMYSITVCAEGRQYLLGDKEGNELILTPIGKIVQESWQRIGTMYAGICIDEYVVMPNHIHGIIIYRNNADKVPLSLIIRNFKSYTTHEYYKSRSRITPNLWERGYYEHIIRYNEMDIIREYIQNNVAEWENDKFYDLENKYIESLHSEINRND